MLLFRSEDHVAGWLQDRNLGRGATMTVAQQWDLARIWYGDRMEPGWRRRTPDEARAVFKQVGLSGPFWALS